MRDDIQLGQVCRILCGLAHRADYWGYNDAHDTAIGQLRPTESACDAARGKEGMSHGEYVLVQIAWAFWNGATLPGAKPLSFAEVIGILDTTRMTAVAELMIVHASSDDALVDEWIARWTRTAFPKLRPAAGVLVDYPEPS